MGQEIKSVLIFEDEPLIGLELETLVREMGAIPLRSGEEVGDALALIEQHRPDAAVLDIGVCHRNANLIADELRRRKVPWIFTATNVRDALTDCEQAVPIIAKPYGAEQIARPLRELLTQGAQLPGG